MENNLYRTLFILAVVALLIVIWWKVVVNHAQSTGFGTGNFSSNLVVGRGVTGSIGGGALLAGACATGTATVNGATVGMAVVANSTDGSFAGGAFTIHGDVSGADTVTVSVCAAIAGTPGAKTYNVAVFPVQ